VRYWIHYVVLIPYAPEGYHDPKEVEFWLLDPKEECNERWALGESANVLHQVLVSRPCHPALLHSINVGNFTFVTPSKDSIIKSVALLPSVSVTPAQVRRVYLEVSPLTCSKWKNLVLASDLLLWSSKDHIKLDCSFWAAFWVNFSQANLRA